MVGVRVDHSRLILTPFRKKFADLLRNSTLMESTVISDMMDNKQQMQVDPEALMLLMSHHETHLPPLA